MDDNIFVGIYKRVNYKQLYHKIKTGFLSNKRFKDRRVDAEIFSSAIILKNLALVEKEKPLSADFIFEEMMKNTNILQPVFAELIGLYRTGHYEEAFEIFSKKSGTKAGKNFAVLLSKIDKVNPSEIKSQMDTFVSMLNEERMTEEMKLAQRKSILATAWATGAVFCLLINFLVVVVLLDTIESIMSIF